MGRDDSWPATVPSVVVFSFSFSDDARDVHDETGSASRVSRLVTVPTDPFIRPTAHFCLNGRSPDPETPQNGGTVLPIANLMVDSESGSPVSLSSILVTIRLSRLVSEIFACDRQMDRQTDGRTSVDHYCSWPPHCVGPANNKSEELTWDGVLYGAISHVSCISHPITAAIRSTEQRWQMTQWDVFYEWDAIFLEIPPLKDLPPGHTHKKQFVCDQCHVLCSFQSLNKIFLS